MLIQFLLKDLFSIKSIDLLIITFRDLCPQSIFLRTFFNLPLFEGPFLQAFSFVNTETFPSVHVSWLLRDHFSAIICSWTSLFKSFSHPFQILYRDLFYSVSIHRLSICLFKELFLLAFSPVNSADSGNYSASRNLFVSVEFVGRELGQFEERRSVLECDQI